MQTSTAPRSFQGGRAAHVVAHAGYNARAFARPIEWAATGVEIPMMLAVDLDNGATFSDIPAPVLARLLTDITGAWHTGGTDTGLLVKVTGTDLAFGDTGTADPKDIAGPLPAVVQWAAGCGTGGVTATGPAPTEGTPAAPRWI